jgi:hypothetical protein
MRRRKLAMRELGFSLESLRTLFISNFKWAFMNYRSNESYGPSRYYQRKERNGGSIYKREKFKLISKEERRYRRKIFESKRFQRNHSYSGARTIRST